jgi:hypothetical protein
LSDKKTKIVFFFGFNFEGIGSCWCRVVPAVHRFAWPFETAGSSVDIAGKRERP